MLSLDLDLSIIDMVLFIIFSLWSAYLTIKDLQRGRTDIEVDIFNLIHGASREVRAYAVTLSDDPKNEVKAKVLEFAMDDYRSACENACEKYVNGKIDRAWFKNMFSTEIRLLVEDSAHARFYASPDSQFRNTVKVYHEWFAVTDRV